MEILRIYLIAAITNADFNLILYVAALHGLLGKRLRAAARSTVNGTRFHYLIFVLRMWLVGFTLLPIQPFRSAVFSRLPGGKRLSQWGERQFNDSPGEGMW